MSEDEWTGDEIREMLLKIAGGPISVTQRVELFDIACRYSAVLDATSGWQPIETAPRDGTSILTVGVDSKHVTETRWLDPGPYMRNEHTYGRPSYYKECGWYWAGWDTAVGPVSPSHWMPLPAPPA